MNDRKLTFNLMHTHRCILKLLPKLNTNDYHFYVFVNS